MIYKFSEKSNKAIDSAHPDFRIWCDELIKFIDCSAIQGYRTESQHLQYLKNGTTTIKYKNSKHSKIPSIALDLVPYQKRAIWGETEIERLDMVFFAGFAKSIAIRLKNEGKMQHSVKWGGDWNGNNTISDTKTIDFPHWELIA